MNGKYFTTADTNSAYNQIPLDEQSRRLTQFGIGNQQYEFNRFFHGIVKFLKCNHVFRRCFHAITNKR